MRRGGVGMVDERWRPGGRRRRAATTSGDFSGGGGFSPWEPKNTWVWRWNFMFALGLPMHCMSWHLWVSVSCSVGAYSVISDGVLCST